MIIPNTTCLVTRRCLERRFFLRPGDRTNETFLYVLAVAVKRFRVRLHAFCVLSNHYHLVYTDPEARMPAFQQYLDSLVGRALNAAMGREDHFWACDGYNAVTLCTPADVADKAAYVLANPVAAGLVEQGRMWPGLWSGPELLGEGRLVAQRPRHFFDPDGDMPKEVVLELTPPPGFESAAAFREAVEAGLADRESAARRTFTRFLGVGKVLAQRVTDRPAEPEPRGTLRPLVASRDKEVRNEALARLRAFLGDYREAWEARREGLAALLFPAGTYQLRVEHGVACVGYG
jgi:REP element-mobilizing transposase RayT